MRNRWFPNLHVIRTRQRHVEERHPNGCGRAFLLTKRPNGFNRRGSVNTPRAAQTGVHPLWSYSKSKGAAENTPTKEEGDSSGLGDTRNIRAGNPAGTLADPRKRSVLVQLVAERPNRVN